MDYTRLNHFLPGSTTQECRPEEVILEVVFGTPSKQCRGLGICMIVEPKYLKGMATECPHFPGYFQLDAGRKMLLARFNRYFLSSQMIARHFSGGLFKVTEAYKVPGRICRRMGTANGLVIGEGVYEVLREGDDWVVVFDGPCLIAPAKNSIEKAAGNMFYNMVCAI